MTQTIRSHNPIFVNRINKPKISDSLTSNEINVMNTSNAPIHLDVIANINLPRHSNAKRKYSSKSPCSVCGHGVRARKIFCATCKSVTHPGCIDGFTNAIFDILTTNNVKLYTNVIYVLMGRKIMK